MKKVWMGLWVLLLAVSLTACGAKETKPTSQKNPATTIKEDVPTFVVDGATAKVGETFTVAVRTENNPGIIALRLFLDYDASVLELVETTEQDFAGITFGPIEKDPFVILWLDAIHPDNATNGVIATLTFRVRDDAPLGTTKLSLSYDPDDIFNAALENITFDTLTAPVTVEG